MAALDSFSLGAMHMSYRRNAENAVTLVELSPSSTAHLRSAQAKATDGTFKAISALNNGFEQDGLVDANNQKATTNGIQEELSALTIGNNQDEPIDANGQEAPTEFTIFPKLPVELQDEIWKCCVPFQPRTIELQSHLLLESIKKEKVVLLSQISKKTRADMFKIQGYVELNLKRFNIPVAFNPEVDILYLSHNTLMDDELNREKVKKCLEKAGVLEKVKCIALFCKQQDLADWMVQLQQYTSLELLFLVVQKVCPVDPVPRTYSQAELKFEHIELHPEKYNAWRFQRTFRPLDLHIKCLQEALARGSEKVAPHVVLVKEVCDHGLDIFQSPREYVSNFDSMWTSAISLYDQADSCSSRLTSQKND